MSTGGIRLADLELLENGTSALGDLHTNWDRRGGENVVLLFVSGLARRMFESLITIILYRNYCASQFDNNKFNSGRINNYSWKKWENMFIVVLFYYCTTL